jgi:Tfp pilus assembly PilM family ATPase
MINGIITNKDAMTRFFQEVSTKLGPFTQDATLLIESNNIRTKLMTLPAVKESKLLEFVQRQFDEISAENDDIFDFTVLGPDKKQGGIEVLGITAGKIMLQNYMDVLASAGFKLKRIDVGANALMKITGFIPQLKSNSNVLAHVDDATLSVTLFEEGVYRISQKYRLANASGTVERNNEVAGNISSMVQFQRSQHQGVTIDGIYILGIPPALMPDFAERARFLELPLYGLALDSQISLTGKANFNQQQFVSSKFLYNIGSMIKK